MQSKRILVTGANGQLGCEMRRLGDVSPNEYIFTDETIEVTRKGKAVAKIHKEQINKLILINDAFTKEREAISFLYCKKRFFITLTPCNKQKAEAFVSSIPYEAKSNWLYYLLVFLSH